MKNPNRSNILRAAWACKKVNPEMSFSQCQVQAWKAEGLKSALKTSVVEFTFIKDDKSTRVAKGTLCSEFFSYTSTGSTKSNHAVVSYFDLDAKNWRCFRVDRLVGIAA